MLQIILSSCHIIFIRYHLAVLDDFASAHRLLLVVEGVGGSLAVVVVPLAQAQPRRPPVALREDQVSLIPADLADLADRCLLNLLFIVVLIVSLLATHLACKIF